MGLLDKFRFKKKQLTPPPEKPALEKKPSLEKRTWRVRSDKILLKPLLSEKATKLAGLGEYVFAVSQQANKQEIRKSIEQVYDVHVEAVKIITLPAKKRRFRQVVGQTSPWKKAIIKVRPGEKIPGIIEAVG